MRVKSKPSKRREERIPPLLEELPAERAAYTADRCAYMMWRPGKCDVLLRLSYADWLALNHDDRMVRLKRNLLVANTEHFEILPEDHRAKHGVYVHADSNPVMIYHLFCFMFSQQNIFADYGNPRTGFSYGIDRNNYGKVSIAFNPPVIALINPSSNRVLYPVLTQHLVGLWECNHVGAITKAIYSVDNYVLPIIHSVRQLKLYGYLTQQKRKSKKG